MWVILPLQTFKKIFKKKWGSNKVVWCCYSTYELNKWVKKNNLYLFSLFRMFWKIYIGNVFIVVLIHFDSTYLKF